MRKIYMLIAALAMLVACDKPIEYNQTLGLLSECNVLSASGGSTDVAVFSNTSWTVRLLSEADWASIDRLSGEGCSRVIFNFERNYGRSRRVILEFRAKDEVRTLSMYQSGSIADADVKMTILNTSYVAPTEGAEKSFMFETNLIYDLKRMELDVAYKGDNVTPWIHLVSISEDKIIVTVDKNESGAPRQAKVRVSHTDEGAWNSTLGDTLYSNEIDVTQE